MYIARIEIKILKVQVNNVCIYTYNWCFHDIHMFIWRETATINLKWVQEFIQQMDVWMLCKLNFVFIMFITKTCHKSEDDSVLDIFVTILVLYYVLCRTGSAVTCYMTKRQTKLFCLLWYKEHLVWELHSSGPKATFGQSY